MASKKTKTDKKKPTPEEIKNISERLGDFRKVPTDKIRDSLESLESEGKLTLPVETLLDWILTGGPEQKVQLRAKFRQKLLWQHFSQVCDGNLSQYLRDTASQEDIDVDKFHRSQLNSKLLNQVAGELNAIGRNLNQLTKYCNSERLTGRTVDALTLLPYLQGIQSELVYIGVLMEQFNPPLLSNYPFLNEQEARDGYYVPF